MGIKEEIFIEKTKYKMDDNSIRNKVLFSKEYMKWLYKNANDFKKKNNIDSIEDHENEFIEYLKSI